VTNVAERIQAGPALCVAVAVRVDYMGPLELVPDDVGARLVDIVASQQRVLEVDAVVGVAECRPRVALVVTLVFVDAQDVGRKVVVPLVAVATLKLFRINKLSCKAANQVSFAKDDAPPLNTVAVAAGLGVHCKEA
jgi:hypothetical protein